MLFKVIPLMGFAIGYLGEKLRDVSNKAHLAVASLSSYLNEVSVSGYDFVFLSI